MNATSFLPFTDYFAILMVLYIISIGLILVGGAARIVGFILIALTIIATIYVAFLFTTLSQYTFPTNGTLSSIIYPATVVAGIVLSQSFVGRMTAK